MKKKSIKKTHKPAAARIHVRISSSDKDVSQRLKVILAITISVFAFVLYVQSIQNNFALDDNAVIQENSITTQGLSGIPTILRTDYWYGSGHNISRGPVYRPTSLVIFATIWQFSPGNPHVYHFINVLLFTATCLLLFLVLCELFKTQNLILPFVCSILYAAHPIHTEVVDNIKSMDEILCFLFGLIAIKLLLKYISSQSKLSYILGGVSFLLSLLSKETGITFLVIIPMTMFFFTDAPLNKIFIVFLQLLVLTGIWLLGRMVVFKDLPENSATTSAILNNTLNAAPDKMSRYATTFYILLRYVRLLVFPYPLSYDYSFAQIQVRTPADPAALFGIFLTLGAGIYSIINFSKKNIVAFGILIFLIALAPVSNLFFLTAATMAERFLYIPSLGFCLILSYFLIRITKTENTKTRVKNLIEFLNVNRVLFFIVVGICALYSYQTASRNKDWKDNLTLFSHDVKISSNSARTNQNLGSALMLSVMKSPDKLNQLDTFNLAEKYFKRALEIYPDFYPPLSHLGVIYIFENKIDSAYTYLKKGIEIMPDDVDLNFNLGLALFHLKKNDEAIKVLNHTIQLSPKHENAYYNLAALYQNSGDYDKALVNYSKVIELDPGNANAYYYSGVILKSRGDSVRAKEFILKAQSLGYRPNLK
jgi:tetratricopeptide (TPR) repeat protein